MNYLHVYTIVEQTPETQTGFGHLKRLTVYEQVEVGLQEETAGILS